MTFKSLKLPPAKTTKFKKKDKKNPLWSQPYCKEMNSANTLILPRSGPCPSWASDEYTDLANTKIAAWWDPEASEA